MAGSVDQAVVEVSTMEHAAFSNEFSFQLFHCLTSSSMLGSSLVQIATAQEINNILSPKRSWQEAFDGFFLDDLGVLCFKHPATFANQMVISESSLSVVLKRRGCPRKAHARQETPLVKSQVRYCTRNNNEGFKQLALPDTRKGRKASKAAPPEVLQITEMQRIGVEECQIDPKELTVDRLMQGRSE
jgi:hypothetical protein